MSRFFVVLFFLIILKNVNTQTLRDLRKSSLHDNYFLENLLKKYGKFY